MKFVDHELEVEPKGKRGSNWSKSEEAKLAELCKLNQHILEADLKGSSNSKSSITQKMKDDIWFNICSAVNRYGIFPKCVF